MSVVDSLLCKHVEIGKTLITKIVATVGDESVSKILRSCTEQFATKRAFSLPKVHRTAFHQKQSLPPHTTFGHALRPRCVANKCNNVHQFQPVTTPSAGAVPISSYGLGRRRDITVKTKGSRAKTIKKMLVVGYFNCSAFAVNAT